MHGERPSSEALRRSALFAGLPPSHLEGLLDHAEIAVLPRGQRLWSAGDRPDRLGVVLSGQVKSVRRLAGRGTILDLALQGDVLGDVAFALGEPVTTSAVCLVKARVLLLQVAQVRESFQRSPQALTSALQSVARRAERLQRQVELLSAGSVTQRLAATLVGLAARAGEPFPGGVLVPLRLRRSDLAALAATRPESVSRHVAAWQRRGLLLLQPAGYLLKDLGALQRIADGDLAKEAGEAGGPGTAPAERERRDHARA
jgi:CRP-like cAMP-binding protein